MLLSLDDAYAEKMFDIIIMRVRLTVHHGQRWAIPILESESISESKDLLEMRLARNCPSLTMAGDILRNVIPLCSLISLALWTTVYSKENKESVTTCYSGKKVVKYKDNKIAGTLFEM